MITVSGEESISTQSFSAAASFVLVTSLARAVLPCSLRAIREKSIGAVCLRAVVSFVLVASHALPIIPNGAFKYRTQRCDHVARAEQPRGFGRVGTPWALIKVDVLT